MIHNRIGATSVSQEVLDPQSHIILLLSLLSGTILFRNLFDKIHIKDLILQTFTCMLNFMCISSPTEYIHMHKVKNVYG